VKRCPTCDAALQEYRGLLRCPWAKPDATVRDGLIACDWRRGKTTAAGTPLRSQPYQR